MRKKYFGLNPDMKELFKIDRKVWLLILLGSLTWSLTMVKSGLMYSFGMGFWGPNGHDGVWHIALAESLSRGLFTMPTFSGQIIKNYHLGFDLILAAINKITTIPVATLYFQIIPPVLALLVGYLTYRFTLNWTKSGPKAFWATFFVYFGGSFGWIVSVLRGQGIGGESMFWAQQGISTLINPPFALSLVLVLSGSIILIKKEKRTIHYVLCALFFGSLIQIKVYAGLLILAGLLVAGVLDLVKNKKWDVLKVFMGTLAVSLVLFLPFIKSSQNLVVFKPFWFLETMMGLSDRFGWPRFYSAMINYRLGQVWFKMVPAYLIALIIFLVGNMGTRVIKGLVVWKWLKKAGNFGWLETFMATIILAGMVVPMLFVQSGTAWNTIQFFYYSLFFSAILTGVALGDILENPKLNTSMIRIIEVAVVVLTIPTTIGTLTQYLPARAPARISNEEMAGLRFLAEQPAGIVLTYPFDRAKADAAKDNPPRPLYLYESTAYVSAFAKKDVYLEDEVNLDITAYSWKERRAEVEAFLNSNTAEVKNFLIKNNISYIYLTSGQKAMYDEERLGLIKIFKNQEVEIFSVNQNAI